MARTVTCDGCGAAIILYAGEDPHAALGCHCCTQDHHHGAAAAATGEPCRPVTHLYIGELAAPGTAG